MLISIMLITLISTNNNISMAIGDVTENPDFWKPTENGEYYGDISALKGKAAPILAVIRNAGVIISVLTLAIIGLKSMFSSVEGKAEYKQKLLPWLIGAFMVFAMTTIPSIIFKLVN